MKEIKMHHIIKKILNHDFIFHFILPKRDNYPKVKTKGKFKIKTRLTRQEHGEEYYIY